MALTRYMLKRPSTAHNVQEQLYVEKNSKFCENYYYSIVVIANHSSMRILLLLYFSVLEEQCYAYNRLIIIG